VTILQQRAEGERLARCPIDPLAGLDRLGALFEEPLDRPVNGESLWNSSNPLADVAKNGGVNTGIPAARIVRIARSL